MSVRKYWISKDKITDNAAVIDEDLFRHIFKVCKHKEADIISLLPGDGCIYKSEVVNVGKKQALVKVLLKEELPEIPKPYINLYLSLPKFTKMDFIVEKSVELGVKSLKPFVSEFSYIKSTSRVSESKVKRWKAIVRSACQQSGRGYEMELDDVSTLEKALSGLGSSSALNLFAYEKAEPVSLKDYVNKNGIKDKENINIFVGSEGGFSQEEVRLFSSYGIEPISLGEQVLRVETACVAMISSIKYELS